MKKRKLITGVIASLILVTAITVLMLAMRQDQKKQEQGVQEVSVENPQLIQSTSKSDSFANAKETLDKTSNQAVNRSKENLTKTGYSVVLTGTILEQPVISMQDAAQIGAEAMETTLGHSLENCLIKMSYVTLSGISNAGAIWNGIVEVDDFTRCEFKVNAENGSILEQNWYGREDTTMAWGKDILDSTTIEYKVDESDMESFSNISVAVDNATCEIISGDMYALQIQYYGDNEIFHYEAKDGTLFVTSQTTNHTNNGFFNKTNTITITIPDTEPLDDVTIHTQNGNVHLSQAKVTTTNLETANGNVIITDSTSDSFVLESMNGNLEVINGVSNHMELQTYNGNIDVTGKLQGETICKTDCGNVTVSCEGIKEEYSYDIETAIGVVTLDHKTEKSPQRSNGNASNTLVLRSIIGNCSLEFY